MSVCPAPPTCPPLYRLRCQILVVVSAIRGSRGALVAVLTSRPLPVPTPGCNCPGPASVLESCPHRYTRNRQWGTQSSPPYSAPTCPVLHRVRARQNIQSRHGARGRASRRSCHRAEAPRGSHPSALAALLLRTSTLFPLTRPWDGSLVIAVEATGYVCPTRGLLLFRAALAPLVFASDASQWIHFRIRSATGVVSSVSPTRSTGYVARVTRISH
ncbi:hypothetical protein BDY21DRAFT_91697 [Lineolata rhizophorae]|uniref:Uncharacterized protein n=1 Tax=Lineolata rhizophorae TaxID=578093 RepID=A0A6A6PCF9_9PEZI|nr:hypothetical protein BDY21DRAFT_91697 [Lineolata rhizophorae]